MLIEQHVHLVYLPSDYIFEVSKQLGKERAHSDVVLAAKLRDFKHSLHVKKKESEWITWPKGI